MQTEYKLTISEIKLFKLIFSLAEKTGYCYASNVFLAETLKRSVKTIEKNIRNLKDLGIIEIETENLGYRQGISRKIYIKKNIFCDLNESLNENDTKVLEVIEDLCKAKGYCFATNYYFSMKVNMRLNTIRRIIDKLRRLGFIECKVRNYGGKIGEIRTIYCSPKIEKE